MSDPKAISVRQRLLSRAKRDGEDFNLVLNRYACLRLLHRLSASPYSEEFLLKGATLFLVWRGNLHRPTRDIDLLGFVHREVDSLAEVMRDLCVQPIEPDGVVFAPDSVSVELIRDANMYGGARCKLTARVGTARQVVQVDIGYGDAVAPDPEKAEIPRLLDDEEPRTLGAYRVETTIAEKFESLVALGLANSRMKDYYDLDILLRTMPVVEQDLAEAIAKTFARRRTQLPGSAPKGLGAEFWSSEHAQSRWKAFTRRNALPDEPLEDVCRRIWDGLAHVTEVARGSN